MGFCRSIRALVKTFPQNSCFAIFFARSWFDGKGLHNVVSNKNVIKNSRHWCMGLALLNRGELSLHFMRFCFAFEIKTIAQHKRNRKDIFFFKSYTFWGNTMYVYVQITWKLIEITRWGNYWDVYNFYVCTSCHKIRRDKNFLAAPKMVSFLQQAAEKKTPLLVQLKKFSALLILWWL